MVTLADPSSSLCFHLCQSYSHRSISRHHHPITNNRLSKSQAGEAEHDPQFEPVIKLTEQVDTKTGEEEDEVLFKM
jgi:hypothetical protein